MPPVRSGRGLVALVALVALVVSPIVIAALSFVGDTWLPAGDWAAMAHRVSQVGTSETPLVGLYSREHAHPGPLGVWSGAPLWRLTGGDTRSLPWTAAIVNVGMVAALAAAAWRTARWPLVLGLMATVGILTRGFGPRVLTDLWNPYLPLLAFLLTIVLAWQAGQGRRLALIVAVVPASFALQSHVGYLGLLAVLAVWLVLWVGRWSFRFSADDDVADANDIDDAGDGPAPSPPPARQVWDAWATTVRRAALLAAVLWLPAMIDAVVGVHNPWNIAKSLAKPGDAVGLVHGLGLVGRYVRPDGPWMGGVETPGGNIRHIPGSGPLPVVLAVVVLLGCLHLARRRRLADVGALASLALVLLVGSIPTAARLPLPLEVYLVQWLKVIGALVWFTVGWTLWRAAEPVLRQQRWRLRLAATAVVAVTAAAVASQWWVASEIELETGNRGIQSRDLVSQLEGKLPPDARIRVVDRGDPFRVYGAGVIYAMIEDGYDVVTEDGASGLKWGPSRRWAKGDHHDVLLTVAGEWTNDDCAAHPDSRRLAYVDGLTTDERDWLTDVQLRRIGGEDQVTDAERTRAEALADRDYRVGVYAGPEPCADEPEQDLSVPQEESALPVAVAGGAVALAIGGWLVRRRRRDTSAA